MTSENAAVESTGRPATYSRASNVTFWGGAANVARSRPPARGGRLRLAGRLVPARGRRRRGSRLVRRLQPVPARLGQLGGECTARRPVARQRLGPHRNRDVALVDLEQ